MTYVEFYAELLAEMTGGNHEVIKQNLLHYVTYIEPNSQMHQEVPVDVLEKTRAAAKNDPLGFMRFVAEGKEMVKKHTTPQ